jgi:hypothetical protein
MRCVFFFSLKNTNSRHQERQKTEDLLKNHVFFDVTEFSRIFQNVFRNNILKKKKKHATQFNRSTCKKILSPIGPAVLKKKGRKLFFSCSKTGFEENRERKKILFCSFFFFFFLLILNHYRFCSIAH